MYATPYLESGRIGALALRNRLVRAATGETMASVTGAVTDDHVRLYGDLARGGAGLIVTGHIYVEPRGQYAPFQLGLYADELVAGFRRPLHRSTLLPSLLQFRSRSYVEHTPARPR